MAAHIFPRLLVKRLPLHSTCLPDCMYLTKPLCSMTQVFYCILKQSLQLVGLWVSVLHIRLVSDFRRWLWYTQSFCGWICLRLQWTLQRPPCKWLCSYSVILFGSRLHHHAIIKIVVNSRLCFDMFPPFQHICVISENGKMKYKV